MSDEPLEFHLNLDAATELEKQSQRASRILERMAAHLAANQPAGDANLEDLVEQEHVRQAAELLFGSVDGSASELAPDSKYVFISFCHEDDAFVTEITNRLTERARFVLVHLSKVRRLLRGYLPQRHVNDRATATATPKHHNRRRAA